MAEKAISFTDRQFMMAIGQIAADFFKRQEPLGAEYEKAIFDNIEDLYETDDKRET